MPDPQIDFIEKPFAWCDLSHAIDGLLAAAAAGCERAPALRTL
jgi:hypothetical protein